jgi:hypothetical protein
LAARDPPGAPTLASYTPGTPPPRSIESSPVYYGGLPPTPRRRRRGWLLPVTVVAVLVAASVIVTDWALTGGTTSASPMNVKITEVDWKFTGPLNCWSSIMGAGKSAGTLQNVELQLSLSYPSGAMPPSCTVHSITVGTVGFSLVTTNTPLKVDAGTNATLNATVVTPSADYTGVLTLDAMATSP